MLVLSRYQDQDVNITVPPSDTETQLRVTIVQSPGKVRLGIDAPLDVTILRDNAIGHAPKHLERRDET